MAVKKATKPVVDPDIEKAIEKSLEPTPTFVEYGEWLEANVPGVEFDLQQVILAMRLYGKFQAHNRENGGTRTRQATSPGTTPAKTKTAAEKPATKSTRGKPAAKAETPAAAKPKSGRRGKVATDTEDAPF